MIGLQYFSHSIFYGLTARVEHAPCQLKNLSFCSGKTAINAVHIKVTVCVMFNWLEWPHLRARRFNYVYNILFRPTGNNQQ
jgi:hypothetical protein